MSSLNSLQLFGKCSSVGWLTGFDAKTHWLGICSYSFNMICSFMLLLPKFPMCARRMERNSWILTRSPLPTPNACDITFFKYFFNEEEAEIRMRARAHAHITARLLVWNNKRLYDDVNEKKKLKEKTRNNQRLCIQDSKWVLWWNVIITKRKS